jgi:two-component system response regulator FlrC
MDLAAGKFLPAASGHRPYPESGMELAPIAGMCSARSIVAPGSLRASSAACAFAPRLAEALLGVPAADNGAQVAMAGEPGRPRVRLAPVQPADAAPHIVRAGDVPLIHFNPSTDPFGCWIAAVLAGTPDRPAASDPASLEMLALAERAAASDIAVLIEGPTGAGKEGVARFIHARSPRAAGPLVAVNCAALPEAMLEAILFGHERGAFTGAAGESLGLFRAAQGGTLLLDEVGELSPTLQAKLLRALQEREVLPLGATRPVPVDARVLAATNRNLAGEVAAGRLREDLYWRLAIFPLQLAPLAGRAGDIPIIAAALLLRHGSADGRWWPTPAAIDALVHAAWPGNVRQLENVLQRALVMAGNGRIGVEHLALTTSTAPLGPEPRTPRPILGSVPALACATKLSDVVRAHEAVVIAEALVHTGGRRIDAARRLGISERTLRYKLAQLAQGAASPLDNPARRRRTSQPGMAR